MSKTSELASEHPHLIPLLWDCFETHGSDEDDPNDWTVFRLLPNGSCEHGYEVDDPIMCCNEAAANEIVTAHNETIVAECFHSGYHATRLDDVDPEVVKLLWDHTVVDRIRGGVDSAEAMRIVARHNAAIVWQLGDWVLMPRSLTAENGAKGILPGEFREEIEVPSPFYAEGAEECIGDQCEGCEHCRETLTQEVAISWTNIKAIYAMAVEHLGRTGSASRYVVSVLPAEGNDAATNYTVIAHSDDDAAQIAMARDGGYGPPATDEVGNESGLTALAWSYCKIESKEPVVR